ncbi:sulfotransferase [Croceitalea rosinachiae]|uniref:Sulfotransferase n=1 Tax=Croceitalea rosinachiae TaxID=3075596 RepID=A0ABU3ACA8_9FLAO|nr:sulfotransferase [Croceitalea sp. F388]MDT0607821.1 sulfotransferase [Croceitalea sp. F388]
MKERPTIIYIMSNQRSGSTLIENVLSKSSQIVSLGEAALLSGHIHKTGPGSNWDWNCSCGESLLECDFWNKIYRKLEISDPREITNTRIDNPKGEDKAKQKSNNDKVKALMNQIYKAVFETTKCNVLVDSSKEAFHGTSLYQNSPFNFKFIYLRRDLRAVSISKQKWWKRYGGEDKSLLRFLLSNYLHRMRYSSMLRSVKKEDIYYLKYEEFFDNPQKILDEMSNFFGFDAYEMPEYMELNNDHTIAGTPNRFEKRKIKYDDQWHSTAKKLPLFNALGYILNKIG